MNDIRYGIRLLLKQPGFTAVVVLTLALGIGANTTVFCWMQAMVLHPYPGVAQGERMVVLTTTRGATMWDTVSYPDVKDFGELKQIFTGVIASQFTPANVTVNGHALWTYGQITTANYFDVLGVRALLGRTFLPEEDQKPGGNPVLVLSEGFWRREFAGDPGVIGKSIELNRHSFTIVGVVPAAFHGTMSGLKFDFWAPLSMHQEVAHFGSLIYRADHWLHTQARLQPGVSIPRAQAAVDTLARHIADAYPDSSKDTGERVLPLWRSPYGGQSIFLPVLSILSVVSLGVLLIVAANVASLLLARAAGRQREIAVRLALGAGRARLIRQLLTESVLLATLGAVGGALLATWSGPVFGLFMAPTHLPIGYEFHPNAQTFGFAALLALGAAVVFGLAPALQASSPNVNRALKEGGRGSTTGARGHRLRGALVVSEIALALLLLIGAGLCLKGFQRARQVDIGFDPNHILVAGVRLGIAGYSEAATKVFYRQLRERLLATPGVEAAALASWQPLGFEGGSTTTIDVEGYQRSPGEDVSIQTCLLSPGYFALMRIPILKGRDFAISDDQKSARVAIVNEVTASRYWPGQNALGRKFKVNHDEITVVGVVKTGKYRSLNEPPRPFLYFPYDQNIGDLNTGVSIRTTGDPVAFAGAMREAIHGLDPGVDAWVTVTMNDYIQAAFMSQRMAAALLAALGGVALALAALGIYGLMAYVVSQRTHEIGIRLALGAQRTDILKLIVGQGATLGAVGVLFGFGGALATTRWLASFLYGVSPYDGLIFVGVALLLGVICLASSYLPARRATRVDPMIALRDE